MDDISANDLFQASAFSKGYNGKCAKGFFTTLIYLLYVPVFCYNIFKFGNYRLYVTDNGMHSLSWRKFFGLAVVFLEC